MAAPRARPRQLPAGLLLSPSCCPGAARREAIVRLRAMEVRKAILLGLLSSPVFSPARVWLFGGP